jgi:polyisoprenoid-binding protein YceI
VRHGHAGLAAAAGAIVCLTGRGASSLYPSQASGPDSTVYVVSPQSVLEVHVGKSGLLAGFGHEHRVLAHAFTGEIVYFPGAVGRSRVSVTVLTDSLRVVAEADSADIPEITRTMRQKTLRVDSFPRITFVSREVTAAPAAADSGGGEHRVQVIGDLTMVGTTRPVSVDMDLRVAADTLRADGGFVVKQTDFGVKPYGKVLGMVKVKNAVRFELHVVAVAAAPAPLPLRHEDAARRAVWRH